MQKAHDVLVEAYAALNRAYQAAEYEGYRWSDLCRISSTRETVWETYKVLAQPEAPHRFETIQTEWAGYKPDGMDYNGHMHPHPDGTFERMGDGLRGIYCAAPLTGGKCGDPNPRYFAVKECEGDGRSELPIQH